MSRSIENEGVGTILRWRNNNDKRNRTRIQSQRKRNLKCTEYFQKRRNSVTPRIKEFSLIKI